MHARGALLLSVALLFGCVAPATPTLSAATDAPLAFELRDCEYFGSFLRVPPSLVDPHVPGEFRLVRDMGVAAIVMLGAATCADATTPFGGGPVSYGWLAVNIQPPEDARLRGPDVAGITIHQYQLARFVADDTLAATMRAGGLTVQDAQLDVALSAVGPSTASLVAAEGAESYALVDGLTPATGGEGNVVYRWRSIEKSASGYGVLSVQLEPDLPRAGTTAGVASFGEGTLMAQILGAPAFGGLVSYGPGYAMEQGSVEWHPRH